MCLSQSLCILLYVVIWLCGVSLQEICGVLASGGETYFKIVFQRSIRAGGLETGLANISSNALWSVYKVNGTPYRCVWKCSIPQTIASASFSVD